MKAEGTAPCRLVALFPHDDAAALVHGFRRRLFAAGISGTLAFPLCIPLFNPFEPLAHAELKRIAKEIRARRGDLPFSLDVPIIKTAEGPLASLLGERFLACPLFPELGSLIPEKECAYSFLPIANADALTDVPETGSSFPIRFRAAYLANLIIRPIGVGTPHHSFEWEQGAPVWLAK